MCSLLMFFFQMQERQTTMVAMAQQVAEAKKEVEAASNDADTLAQRIESKQQLHAEAQRDTAKIHFNRNKCQQHIDKIRGTLNVMESTLQDINERLSVSLHFKKYSDFFPSLHCHHGVTAVFFDQDLATVAQSSIFLNTIPVLNRQTGPNAI